MTPRRFMPALLLLFVGSGCAALIYEIVWFQLLQLVIGSSAVSLGVLLGTFMGGMCLGSLLLPRYVGVEQHPLRIYAYLEFGIGACALVILFGMPLFSAAYTAVGTTGITGLTLRGVAAAVCLLPPTLMMGATLPAVARYVETTPKGVSWLGFFYGGNIAGAVAGSLLAGFYLLRVYDATIATFVAVFINVLVAVLGLLIANMTPYSPQKIRESSATAVQTAPGESEVWPVYVTIALSGFAALSSEVIWTRLLSLLFGATVYTFSLVLAAFLFGLGIGSSLGAALARGAKNPRVALGWCQMMLCGAIAWAAYQTMESMPWWPVDVTLDYDFMTKFQLDMVRCIWALLPASILWGASFPLALASVAPREEDAGRVVGRVYAANTVGAIFGALLASLTFVSWIGMQKTQQALIGVSAVSGLLMLALGPSGEESAKAKLNFAVTVIVAMVISGLLVVTVPELNKDFVAYGRFSPVRAGRSEVKYVGEGRMGLVAVSELSDGTLNYHNAGKIQASSDPADMRLQRMLGHLTTLIPAFVTLAILYGATLEGVGRRLWTILLWVGVAWNIYRVFQLMNDFTYIVPTPIW